MNSKHQGGQLSAASNQFSTQPATPVSPVAGQVHQLNEDAMRLADSLDRLIEKARTAMSGDPRHEDSACASPEPAYSCELEGELAELSGKFSRANRTLRSVIDRIQL